MLGFIGHDYDMGKVPEQALPVKRIKPNINRRSGQPAPEAWNSFP
jgi:hypothetical protein